MSEKRQNVRQKSLLRGIVYFDGSPCATECVVRDISDMGARIKFAARPAGATELFELQVPLKSIRHCCRVVWESGDEFGVSFEAEPAASGDAVPLTVTERMTRLEAELAALKHLVRRLQREQESAVA